MRLAISLFTILLYVSCNTKPSTLPITGTWKLISGTLIEKNDTTVTDYTQNKQFIKVINDSHFSFLGHDLNKGKDSATAFFSSGGGKYTLKDSTYTEHLEYCSDRSWENNDFSFTVTIHNDTLIQQGIEKIAATGVNRLNIEKYVRMK
ncbi:hypothetical protein A3860_05715 [Niastella vici]|uniref:Lipocalin-like domain-containing protein n=1 Tax=Niastella vici TaxID=1703345 RepID=A0A1V9FS36_9BACT|nr:hypothetical protein [Niastella vici]OQP61209.1 hypothetical protein A3860_05715 [Niastella vici]